MVDFYGTDTRPVAAVSFYQDVVGWAQAIGCPPDKLAISDPRRSKRPISFRRGDAWLQHAGFEGVRALSLVAMLPEGRIPVDDFLLAANWSTRHPHALVAVRSSLATLASHSSAGALLSIAQRLIKALRPAYGIGYTRPHRLGPVMYAIGIAQGLGPAGYGVGLSPAEEEEALAISRWGPTMSAQVWREGLLRDVYQWNFLTQPHLDRLVDGTPLEHWVQQGTGRGTLTAIEPGMALWEVPEGTRPAVRAALQKAGALVNRRLHQ